MQISFKKIVLATDFSEASEDAGYYAMKLAQLNKVRLLKVLHVLDTSAWDVSPIYYFNVVPRKLKSGSFINETERIPRQEKDTFTRLAKSFGLDVQIICIEGAVGEEIVYYAEERNVDLLVLGTHGYTGWRRYALGSVAEFVIRHASCPVLTVGKRFSQHSSKFAA